MAFALVVATVFGAAAHVGHARQHMMTGALQAHQQAPADAHFHDHAKHVGVHADHADATADHEHSSDCPSHASCGDLYCHGALLIPTAIGASAVPGHAARNDLAPPALRSAVLASLERPPKPLHHA